MTLYVDATAVAATLITILPEPVTVNVRLHRADRECVLGSDDETGFAVGDWLPADAGDGVTRRGSCVHYCPGRDYGY
jgi:hypothetical protein